MLRRGSILFGALLIVLLAVSVSAQQEEYNHVISNSENWRDVYSTMHFANLNQVESDFLVSTRHGTLLLPGLNPELDFLVVSSRDRPFVINYPDILEDSDFTVVDELTVRNANLELIDELPDVRDFIIVGNTYGYDAIAVAPYAVQKGAWVFFADRTTITEIESVLSSRDVDSVVIYGVVDREVRDALQQFNPEEINNGDRFEDNIEIVERYLDIRPTQQVALTNGEFIERGVMSGFDPVLFTGKENVPDQIRDYLQRSDFSVGVLIGSDLVGAATNIRRTTGISVIVKFAQGARNPSGPVAAVEGLDLYYLPIPIVDLALHSAKYNRATSQLEITYRSDSNIPIYFRGSITPIDDRGEGARIGDVEPIFIAPDDFKTVSYPDIELVGDDLALEIFTLFGDSPSSLENILEARVDIEIVNVVDSCEIDIDKVVYSKPKDSFIITIENLAPVDCWVDVELNDVVIDGIPTTIGSVGSIEIRNGKKGKVVIEQELADEDFADNPFVDLTAYYGERQDSLVKVLQGRFEFDIKSISGLTIAIILILIILLFFIFLLLWRRRKDKDEW